MELKIDDGRPNGHNWKEQMIRGLCSGNLFKRRETTQSVRDLAGEAGVNPMMQRLSARSRMD